MSSFFDLLFTQELMAIDGEIYNNFPSTSEQMQLDVDINDVDINGDLSNSARYNDVASTVEIREDALADQLDRNLCTYTSLPNTPRSSYYEIILQLPESDFRRYFQMNQRTAVNLVQKIMGYDLSQRMPIDAHGSALCSLLIAFHYFATGEYDFNLPPELLYCRGFHKLNRSHSAVRNIIVDVARYILQLKQYIFFPKSIRKQRRLIDGFEDKFGIDHTLGCIDCLHVSITKPRKEAAKFLNRHKYHSVNVEAVCDSNLMFLSVRVFPGSSNDCVSFPNSYLRNTLSETWSQKHCDVESITWLLSDFAYPVDTFLMPPYEFPESEYEFAFNNLHMSAFDETIKRAFELLRTTFTCLLKYKKIDFEPKEVHYIVGACFVLYNILLQQGDINFDADVYEVDDMDETYKITELSNFKNCPIGIQLRNIYAMQLLNRNS